MISRHAGQLAESPQDTPPDPQWPPRESGVGDERDPDGSASDRKQQKKKKKRRPRDDLADYVEVKGHGEAQTENTPPSPADSAHKSPRKDGGWEREEGGRGGGGGGRVKKGKSRKKIPEEWAINAEPFIPASAAAASAAQLQEFGELPEEGAMPASLTQDLLCLTATTPSAPSMPANQAAAFSPKGIVTSSPMPEGSFPVGLEDSLMDADASCLGDAKDVSFSPFPLGKADPLAASPLGNTNPFLADSGVYEETMFVPDHSFGGSSSAAATDGSARDPLLAFQTSSASLDTPMEALISAPPFTPSGAVWSLNDSQHNNNSHGDPFAIPGMDTLDFTTSAPVPVPMATSPKEKTPKGRKSRTSSSSSAKSPTSPGGGVAKLPSSASPASSPPQNSGLNPAAPPFFPSFAEPLEPLAALLPALCPLEGLLWSGAWIHSLHDHSPYSLTG